MRNDAHTRGALLTALLAAVVACFACAERAAPPALPTTLKYPDFMFPAIPPALQRAAGVEHIEPGWRYLQNGDTRAADREFDAALRREPTLYPARTGEAYVALARGEHDEALSAFDAALARARDYVPALVGRGQVLLALKRDAEALASFEAALAADESLVAVRRRVEVLRFRTVQQVIEAARSAAAAGRLDEARIAYDRALAISPESSFLYRERAAVERRQGSGDRALQDFRRAIDLDPADVLSLIGVGDLLVELQDYPAAEAAYRKAAAIEPTSELEAKIGALVERGRESKLPAEFRAIGAATQITRADLAALIGIRLANVLDAAPPQQVVITDTGGHWAANWITQVARAGVMDPFENHTFQPHLVVRRGDLAAAVSRLVTRIGARNTALRKRVAEQPAITDMSPGHLSYPAVAVAVASGVMPLVEGGGFDVNRPVTGADALEVISRLQALLR